MRRCRGRSILAVVMAVVLASSGMSALASESIADIHEEYVETVAEETQTDESEEPVLEEKTEAIEAETETKTEAIETETIETEAIEIETKTETAEIETETNTEIETVETETAETETETEIELEFEGVQLVDIAVNEYAGYEEGAYVEWQPVETADGYIVYTSSDNKNWTAIDDELIRSYGSYIRADALGLTAGKWYLKIEAATFNSAREKLDMVGEKTVEVTVVSHDRSGFAWTNGTSSGAYNEDGSLRNGAHVLYVTELTKDTVSLNVTGATTNPCVGIQTILDGYKKGKEKTPLCIRVIGNVTQPKYTLSDDIVIENKKTNAIGITIEGVGEDATANGWGIRVKSASNVEIRNLGFMNRSSAGEKDNVGLQQDNDHVWVHHCDMFYGNAGKDADQIKGDGALDCKKSSYVTFSYNHFWDSGKCSLLGLSEGTNDLYVTYHHNWFDHSDSRHPRIRFFTTHVYNNYYDGNAKYGIGAAKGGASVYAENNYFRNCKYPMLISMQGSDVWDGTKNDYTNNPTFSKEDGSIIKAYGNIMVGQTRFIPYAETDDASTAWNESVDFDAYVVGSRTDTVPSTVKTAYGSFTYNNFDTQADCYIAKNDYKLDAAEDVPAIVKANAGRLNGGDFKWTFSAEADTVYAVDMDLKNKLLDYKSSLVSVGGIMGASVKVYYKVTFDPANGEDTTTVEVEAYTKVDKPADPTVFPEGKISFDCWMNGSSKWNFDNKVTGDMTLTARYLAEGDKPAEDEGGGSGGTGDSSGDDNTGGDSSGGTEITDSAIVYDITKDGLSNEYFTVTGKINSKSLTSAEYNGTSYTGNPLKIESSTSIKFTTAVNATLILLFEAKTTGKIKIDGVDVAITAGVTNTTIEPGSHEITKNTTANLFAIIIIPDSDNENVPGGDTGNGGDTGDDDPGNGGSTGDDDPGNGGNTGDDDTGNGGNTGDDDTGNGGNTENTDGLKVTLAEENKSYTYTGGAITPEIIVTNNGEVLTEGTDYTVKYSSNIKTGNATITVTGKNNLSGSCSATFKIEPKNIADEDVSVGNTVIAENKKAAPTLAYNGIKLGTKDYTIDKADKLTQSCEIMVTGKGNYTGSRSVLIEVVKKDSLKKFKVSVNNAAELVYNGASLEEKIAGSISVTDAVSGEPLSADNYELVFPKNTTNAGKVKLTIIGKNVYTGSVTKNVTIKPMAADGKIETVINKDGYEYRSSGTTINDLVVNYKAASGELVKLTKGKDYKIAYSGNKKVGTAKYTVSFIGNYKGTKSISKDFTIKAADLSKAKVTAADMVYTGKAQKYFSKPYVTLKGSVLKNSDYTVKYYKDAELSQEITGKFGLEDSADAMTVYIKVTGKGNCDTNTYAAGSYKLCRSSTQIMDLSKAKVTFVDESGTVLKKAEYTGKAVEPKVKVECKINGTLYTIDESCYTVAYVNNIEKGKATAVITATGKTDEKAKCAFAGSKTATFTIAAKNLSGIKGFLDGLFKTMGL